MLILIVIGAGIVFVVWNNSRKRQKNEQDKREVEESTNKFKLELEKTANEIIGRMETQAAHLENLLEDSERNRTQLEGRVVELKKLLKRGEGQATEIRDLLERLDDAVDDVSAMQKQMDIVERKINAAINVQIPKPQLINPLPMTSPPLINPLMQQPQPQTPPIINSVQSPITPPPIIRTAPPVTAPEPPAEEFSKVLEKTMEQEETPPPIEPVMRPPDRNSIVLSRESKQPATVINAEPVKIESPRRRTPVTKMPVSIAERQARVLAERQGRNSDRIQSTVEALKKPPTVSARRSSKVREAAVAAINDAVEQENTIDVAAAPVEEIQPLKTKVATLTEKPADTKSDSNPDSSNIREMLLSGMTVEEIAKETGLGRGAIELVQQMTRRQLERS